jgi:hypothetical protein
MNIESVAFNDTADHKGRSVTVKYFLSDPTNGNAAYNLVSSDCTSTPTLTCANTTKFGNLRFYLAYQNMVGQPAAVTEYSAYNNGGSTANAYAYKGTNDGSNHYTVSIAVPDDSATAVAAGTARVLSIGQIKEPQLAATSGAAPRPLASPAALVSTATRNSPCRAPCSRGAPLFPTTSATPATAAWAPLQAPTRSPTPSTAARATRWRPASSVTTPIGFRAPS